MVKLNAKNVINEHSEIQRNLWLNCILNNIKAYGEYFIIGCVDLVGCFLAVFALLSHKKKIYDIDADFIKCGFGGNLGNKGGIAIKFKFENMKMSFLNCHLPAGKKNIQSRIESLEDIYKKAFNNKYQQDPILTCDLCFLFGDLNFRSNQSYGEVMQ